MNWIGKMGLRPEATRISKTPTENSIPATIIHSTFLGNFIHIQAQIKTNETLTIEVSRFDQIHQPGDEVHLWWRKEDELHFQ